MAIEIARRLFTLEEYNYMIKVGVFHEDETIEFIRGEIVKKSAIGPAHRVAVGRISSLFGELLGRAVQIWVQNSIDLPEQASSPEPDLLVLKWRDDYYARKRHTPKTYSLS